MAKSWLWQHCKSYQMSSPRERGWAYYSLLFLSFICMTHSFIPNDFPSFFLSNVYYSSNLLSPLTVGELSLCTDISLLTQPLRLTYMIQIFLLYTNLNALHFGDLQFQHVTNQSRIFFHGTLFLQGISSLFLTGKPVILTDMLPIMFEGGGVIATSGDTF